VEVFVVRVWTPATADADVPQPLRGFVEHVRGERRPFEGGAALLAHLQSSLEASGRRGRLGAATTQAAVIRVHERTDESENSQPRGRN
jgi:hypothetical protein